MCSTTFANPPLWTETAKVHGVKLTNIGMGLVYNNMYYQSFKVDERLPQTPIVLADIDCKKLARKWFSRCRGLVAKIISHVEIVNRKFTELKDRPKRSIKSKILFGGLGGGIPVILAKILGERRWKEIGEQAEAHHHRATEATYSVMSSTMEIVRQVQTEIYSLESQVKLLGNFSKETRLSLEQLEITNQVEGQLYRLWDAARQLDNEIVRYDLATTTLKQGRLPPNLVPPTILEEQLREIEQLPEVTKNGHTLLLKDVADYYSYRLVAGYQRTNDTIEIVTRIPLSPRYPDERLIFNYQFQPFLAQTSKNWETLKIAEPDGTVFTSVYEAFTDRIEHWDCQGIAPRAICIGSKPAENAGSNCIKSIWNMKNSTQISKNCHVLMLDDNEETSKLWKSKFENQTPNKNVWSTFDAGSAITNTAPLALPPTYIPSESLYVDDLLTRTQRMILTQAQIDMDSPPFLNAKRQLDHYDTSRQWMMSNMTMLTELLKNEKAIAKFQAASYLKYEGELIIETPTKDQLYEKFLHTAQWAVLNDHPFPDGLMKENLNQIGEIIKTVTKSHFATSQSSDGLAKNVFKTSLDLERAFANLQRHVQVMVNAFAAAAKHAKTATPRQSWHKMSQDLEKLNQDVLTKNAQIERMLKLLNGSLTTLREETKRINPHDLQTLNTTLDVIVNQELPALKHATDKITNTEMLRINANFDKIRKETQSNQRKLTDIFNPEDIHVMNRTLSAIQGTLEKEIENNNRLTHSIDPINEGVEELRQRMKELQSMYEEEKGWNTRMTVLDEEFRELRESSTSYDLFEREQKLNELRSKAAQEQIEALDAQMKETLALIEIAKSSYQQVTKLSLQNRTPLPIKILITVCVACFSLLFVVALLKRLDWFPAFGLFTAAVTLPGAEAFTIPSITISPEDYWQYAKDFWIEIVLWPICLTLALGVIYLTAKQLSSLVRVKKHVMNHYYRSSTG